MDYEIQRCTRRCAGTDREFGPGETFYSVLLRQGADLVRRDYSPEAWDGPPEEAIGWWKSQVPRRRVRQDGWAPNDVMLDLFEQLADRDDQSDLRFVLALLLVRRRVIRQDDTIQDDRDQEVMVLYCPRRDTTYQVAAVTPDEQRIDEIQEELSRLLFS